VSILIEEIEQRVREHIAREQREQPKARHLGDPLPNVDALTPEFLT
jgi:hypothetical protein